MKRQIKTVVAVATLAWTASSSLTADACDRGGRRVSIGRGRIGISISPLRRYSPPVYRQPQGVYSQPTYSQPTYPHPPGVHSQSVPTTSPAPVVSNRMVSPPVTGNQVSAGAPRPVVPSQNAGQVQQVNNRPAGTSSSPQPNAGGNGKAEASALQLLASITDSGDSNTADKTTGQIPEFSAAASSETGSHVGTWKVSLPGNQAIELVLEGDNRFNWTATKDGKSSRFEGQYRLEEGRLTLVRSSDLQQMAGSWTGQGSGFTFKLDGATTAGLNFNRS